MICNEFEGESDTLVTISDIHMGNKNTDVNAFKRVINDVRKNGYHLIVLGDLCECITANDKRFDIGSVDPEFLGEDMINKQYKSVEKILKPVADQILTIHCGNHDQSITKKCHVDMVKNLCENLDVNYSYYSALSRLSYIVRGKKFSYTLYTTHGYASGRQKGGKVNALESLSAHIDFDVAFAGHSHDLFILNRQKMFLTKFGHLGFKTLYFGNAGSFLRGFTEGSGVSYAEKAGYRPLPTGYIKTIFNPREYGVKMEEVIM